MTYKFREIIYQGDLQKMTNGNFLPDLDEHFPLSFPSLKVAIISKNQRQVLLEAETCLKTHNGKNVRCFNVL